MSPTSRFVNSVIFSAGFICASQLYGEQQDLVPYAQEQQGNYELAIEGYSSLIDELEATGGLFSPDLIDPLLGLARSHLALKDLEAAEDSAARAQHVQHRNEGVLSLDQLAAVDIKTKIHLLNGVPT
ncbi:MAG: tetratricopeptide repeat protein, partial [Gammaproteobacteria bacterium]|nr:tetratricopeptide repeat protein [Gammaproteobacteria bacterium]